LTVGDEVREEMALLSRGSGGGGEKESEGGRKMSEVSRSEKVELGRETPGTRNGGTLCLEVYWRLCRGAGRR